ncbi:tRNA 2-thiocytidine(32) synthetase TtcA [Aliikangiella sp. G2MR2-5]|uniref:tRNA 2-thiocytidine(32) synthetase TtcA n=1 Tax=Aliikangiella sp. G2MR2-5 TaxID=2788943 RepID=UPI0018ABC126|nr:tRNA 2-thiocytidine(32) synthetase TtcA [Aliikangiella sp. G2MR2-5]
MTSVSSQTPSSAESVDAIETSSAADTLDKKQKVEYNKLQKRLRRNVGRAIDDFKMIEDGDKIMVCLSGGKDSYAMLEILMNLQKSAPVDFNIVAVNLDQKQPGFPEDVLPNYLSSIGVDYHIIEEDTYSIVREKIPEGKTTCSLCSRLRRGIIYSWAQENGITKIALGHHREDIMETLFLNMFFGGKLKSMPPKLLSDDGKNTVIRPMAYCKEADIARFAELKEFPIIPCNLCGSQENLQRKQIKQMLKAWENQFPGRIENIFRSIANVAPSHLMDRELFPFADLNKNVDVKREAETLFDEPEIEKQQEKDKPKGDVLFKQLV